MLLPGIALIAASVYAAEIRAPEIALDKEAIRIISEAEAFDGGQTAVTTQKSRPKINKSASSSAKGLAAGAEAPKPSGARTIGHDSSLDNADFKDGTYIGAARGFSGIVKVKVAIKDGKIKSVSIISHSDTPSYFNRARKVASSIVSKQSTRVDTVSGATYSSNGIIKAAENALRKAAGKSEKQDDGSKKKNKKKAGKEKTSKKKYKDGTYTASAEGYHGPVTVKVTIKNGKIAKVSIVSHTDTPSYFNRAKKLIKKITKYNRADVDTVSGATYSSKGIINAVKKALKKASGKKSGGRKKPDKPDDKPEEKISDTKYENGTYEGSAVGYTGGNGIVCMTYVTVTVSDNRISAIEVESQDPTLSGDDWYWTLVYPKIPDKIVETNNPEVDTVSGATMSSNGIINAVKNALEGHELKENEEETDQTAPETDPTAEAGNGASQDMQLSVQSDDDAEDDEEPSSQGSSKGSHEEAVIPEQAPEKEEKKEQPLPPDEPPQEVKEPEPQKTVKEPDDLPEDDTAKKTEDEEEE